MDRRKVAAVYRHLADHPDQIILWVILSIITAIIVILLVKSEPQIKGSGIPQVEGKLSGEIDYNWFSVLWKSLSGAFYPSDRVFLGREGPSIQLGAAVGQGLSQFFEAPKSEEKY